MRPLLALTEDGELHPIADVRDSLAEQFDLSEDDLTERIPSGRVTTLQNRVGWFGDDCWRHGLSVRRRTRPPAVGVSSQGFGPHRVSDRETGSVRRPVLGFRKDRAPLPGHTMRGSYRTHSFGIMDT